MSDYEGDDWDHVEDVSNRGNTNQAVEGFSSHAAPRGQTLQDYEADWYSRRKQGKRPRRPRLAHTFHPKIQNIRPVAHHGTGGRPIQVYAEFEPRRFDLEAFRRAEALPDSPDQVYEFDRTWREFIHRIPHSETSKGDVAIKRLDAICVESRAFIRPQDLDTNKLYIWGNDEQCDLAVSQLEAWDISFRVTRTQNSERLWHRERAYDGRREHRLMQDNMRKLEDESFDQADDSIFGFEAYLVWPIGYDLDAYLKEFEALVLKDISREFMCRFYHERKDRLKFTKVQAMTEHDLLAAYQRLINLVKEMVSEKSKGTHGNLFKVPSLENYRDTIVVAKDSGTPTFTIALQGTAHLADEKQDWDSLVRVMERRNRKEIKNSLEAFITSLHVSQCQIRLRIEFGDINLISYQKASDGTDNFHTDDFFEMLQNSRTELSDPLLRAKHKNMYHLYEALRDTEQLHFDQENYKVLFDFQGADNFSRLRLECEFRPSHDRGESQSWAKRWTTSKSHRSNENVLGLKVVDLEKPSFMIRADCYNLFTGNTATGDMHAFQEYIKYKPAPNGLTDHARRRSVYPPGKRDLVSITEITAARFHFRDTGGRFELRREDTYEHRDGYSSAYPNSSRWVASYYYDRWDSLMDAYANTKPGEEVEWRHELSTFIPENVDPAYAETLPHGYKNLMREVTAIQELLKDALERLPELYGPGHALGSQTGADLGRM